LLIKNRTSACAGPGFRANLCAGSVLEESIVLLDGHSEASVLGLRWIVECDGLVLVVELGHRAAIAVAAELGSIINLFHISSLERTGREVLGAPHNLII
jgi:hypothetical protein